MGFHTAKELARKKATVIIPARDMRKGKEAAERIEAEVPKARLYLAKLDLARVRFGAGIWRASPPTLWNRKPRFTCEQCRHHGIQLAR